VDGQALEEFVADQVSRQVTQQQTGETILEDLRIAVDDQVRRPSGRRRQGRSARLSGVHSNDCAAPRQWRSRPGLRGG
jgi:hypothetical protein